MAARDFEICIDARDPELLRPFWRQLIALGGTVLAGHPRFTTLADPEGNELCVNRGGAPPESPTA